VWFNLTFCLGIIIANFIKIPFFLAYGLTTIFLVLSLCSLKKDLRFHIFLFCFVFLLGITFLRNSQILPNCHIAKLIAYKSESSFLIGIIDNDPAYQDRNVSFILKAEKLKINETWQKTCGKVLVKVFPAKVGAAVGARNNGFSYGDRLFLEGNLYRPFSFSKSEFNYKVYLKHQNIYLILRVKKDSIVKQLNKNVGNPVKSFAFQMRHKMKGVIVKNLSPFSAGILNAIILGERQNLPGYVRDTLVYSGTVHIIAISGLHLGIVAFITLLILKIIKIPRKPRYILTILLLIVYCILSGANTPVIRATIMTTMLLFSYFFKREVNIYNSLSVAALIIVAFNPWQLFEVSFQLSFLSVVSIVWLSPKIKSLFPEKLNKITRIRFLISIFSVSFAAWLGLLPLIVYYFRILSPITILANMIIVPYMTIIVASGFSLALIGILIPSLAAIFAVSNELFILILFRINSFLIALPGAYFKLPNIPFICVLLYYILLISIFNFSKIPIITQIIGRNDR